ncbi:B-cell CLL/lymphoma 7 protein family member B isoform X2 [Marmota flaviventris]|uniref:B-cell CLL/lymphoma 7 protein family member B isoform X2 n=1 Tax=Marmota flaviventris TaxID=93162 RepID=UPI003A86D9A7
MILQVLFVIGPCKVTSIFSLCSLPMIHLTFPGLDRLLPGLLPMFKEKSKSNSSTAREPNGFPSDASANSSLLLEFQDENSNQSSVSDVCQLKVDSSTSSSPSPQQSESLSPAHTSDFRTDDSQPPTLGQEILEEPSLPASEVADEPPTLTKEEPVPLETQIAEEEEDSGAPPLKRFCVDQPPVPQTASES